MPLPVRSRGRIKFGEFLIDLQTGELSSNGHKSTLSEQPLQLLIALLEQPGELVTRDELRKRLWGSETYVEFDLGLNKAMNRLRESLKDSAEHPRYIETLPRRGYRFIASPGAEEVASPEPTSASKGQLAEASASLARKSQRVVLRRWMTHSLLIVAVILVGVLAARSLWTRSEPRFHQLTFRRGSVFTARFAPDGRAVLYTAAWDGNPGRTYSTRPEFPESRSLGSIRFHILAVSQLGEMAMLLKPNFVAHRQHIGTLAVAPLSGGAPRELADGITDADWSPNGKELAVVRGSQGRYRIEFPIGTVRYETSGWISDIRFSKEGDTIAFVDHTVFPDDGGAVALLDLNGRKSVLSKGWNSIEGLAWSADGKEVWFGAGALQAVTRGGKTRAVLRAGTDITLHDISRTGSVLLSEDNKAISMMMSAADGKGERDLSWLKSSVVTDISSDGKTILFSEEYTGGGPSYSTYVRRIDETDAFRLGQGGSLALSGDNKWAGVAANVAGREQFLLVPTGPGTPKRVDNSGIQNVYMMSWLPDNIHFLYSGAEAGHGPRIYLGDVNGGKPVPMTPEWTYAAASWSGNIISPDGKQFFAKDSSHNLWIYPVNEGPGRRVTQLAPAEIPFQWTSNGEAIYVYRQAEIPSRVYRIPIASGKKLLWKELKPADPTGVLDIIAAVGTPDGSSVAYSFDRWLSDIYVVEDLK